MFPQRRASRTAPDARSGRSLIADSPDKRPIPPGCRNQIPLDVRSMEIMGAWPPFSIRMSGNRCVPFAREPDAVDQVVADAPSVFFTGNVDVPRLPNESQCFAQPNGNKWRAQNQRALESIAQPCHEQRSSIRLAVKIALGQSAEEALFRVNHRMLERASRQAGEPGRRHSPSQLLKPVLVAVEQAAMHEAKEPCLRARERETAERMIQDAESSQGLRNTRGRRKPVGPYRAASRGERDIHRYIALMVAADRRRGSVEHGEARRAAKPPPGKA